MANWLPPVFVCLFSGRLVFVPEHCPSSTICATLLTMFVVCTRTAISTTLVLQNCESQNGVHRSTGAFLWLVVFWQKKQLQYAFQHYFQHHFHHSHRWPPPPPLSPPVECDFDLCLSTKLFPICSKYSCEWTNRDTHTYYTCTRTLNNQGASSCIIRYNSSSRISTFRLPMQTRKWSIWSDSQRAGSTATLAWEPPTAAAPTVAAVPWNQSTYRQQVQANCTARSKEVLEDRQGQEAAGQRNCLFLLLILQYTTSPNPQQFGLACQSVASLSHHITHSLGFCGSNRAGHSFAADCISSSGTLTVWQTDKLRPTDRQRSDHHAAGPSADFLSKSAYCRSVSLQFIGNEKVSAVSWCSSCLLLQPTEWMHVFEWALPPPEWRPLPLLQESRRRRRKDPLSIVCVFVSISRLILCCFVEHKVVVVDVAKSTATVSEWRPCNAVPLLLSSCFLHSWQKWWPVESCTFHL